MIVLRLMIADVVVIEHQLIRPATGRIPEVVFIQHGFLRRTRE
jgi:hypothetical protein